MNLRRSFLLFCSCLALGACDSGSEETTGGGSTSGGDEGSSTSATDPTGVSASASATTPTTEPTTLGESSGSDGSTGGSTSSVTSGSGTTGADSSSSGDETGTTTGGGATVTIYDVQDGTVAEGEMVTIEGVVITGLREGVGVFVQEIDGGEYSGVYVDTAEFDLSTFAVGDIVDVSGVTSEDIGVNGLGGLTAILADGLVAGEGTMKLSPQTVDAAILADTMTAEPWEGVLVQISGDLTATTFGDFFGEFSEFAATSGEDAVLVDDFLYNIFDDANLGDFPGFAEGATFTDVAGVLNYSFDNHKIAPRGAAGLAGYIAPPPP